MTIQHSSIRLQKLLAERGLCSRRTAEQWIGEGRVLVNSKVATLGQKVDPACDQIKVDNSLVRQGKPERLVLAFNKPKGYVCTHTDPHEAMTIFTLLPKLYNQQKLMFVGRLDKDSEGLVILTNDGGLVYRLTHPSYGVTKRYYVLLDRPFDRAHTQDFLKGVYWEGERLHAKKVILADTGPERERRLEIHLEHGRKREIRNLCLALGYHVKRLRRFQIGKYVLRGVAEGHCKLLSEKEIELLGS